MKKSALTSWASLMVAIKKVGEIENVSPNFQLLSCNSPQWDFTQYFKAHQNEVDSFNEVKSFSSEDYNGLKNFLEKNKINTNGLKKFQPDNIGIAALLNEIYFWKDLPKNSEISQDSSVYQALCFKSSNLEMLKPDDHTLIFKIPLKNGDWFVVTVENFPKAILNLNNQFIDLLDNSKPYHSTNYKGLVLPCISINRRNDTSWLSDLRIKGKDLNSYPLTQVIHQSAIAINQDDVHKNTIPEPSTPDYYKINRPFLFGVIRPNIKTPLLVGYSMPDSWIKK